MKYLCIYNTDKKLIQFEQTEDDTARLPFTSEAMRLQAMVSGPGWAPYCEDKPFSWPIDNPPQP
jgi:hypothetical protein